MTNTALERSGSSQRVDHRSYERQGIDRDPGRHYGPAAAHVTGRGGEHDRLDDALAVGDHAKALADVERQIARLEAAREAMLRDVPDEEPQRLPADSSPSSRGDQRNDQSWER